MKKPGRILIAAMLLCVIGGGSYSIHDHKLQANIRRTEDLMERAKVESQKEIAHDLIRFHVLANSDAREDQNIKALVRDEVLKEVVPYFQRSQSLEESRRILQENKGRMIQAAEGVLKEKGMDYGVKAALGTFSFPTKYYGDFSLPAGEYEAFRLVLGEGRGTNWWCVMFPPLCFVNVEEEAQQEEDLSLEDPIEPDTQTTPSVQIRWKFLELIQSLF